MSDQANESVQADTVQKIKRGILVFLSYSHEDKKDKGKLFKQLASLERAGLITRWHDHEIRAGDE
jgi:hypothetical protein